MLTLLGRSPSINVRKVLWLCAEMQLPIAHEEWGTPQLPLDQPLFLSLNPNAQVPVLRDGGFVLWESNSICRYLAGREKRADLLPTTPAARAQVEQWMDWQLGDLNNAWRYAFMGLVRHSPAHADPALVARSLVDWTRLMQILDTQLSKTGAFVTGEDFTLADVVIGLSVHRWFSTPLEDRLPLPAVDEYYAQLSMRPAFQLHGRNGMP
ncbi:glutathione S-transferase [Ideonella azotifigens]|uniref:Glutathione S-transferase n=1 Tax=Ideonella azotifigens TaxID=513160 RepID=A0ABP3V9Q6_9BURK|nr:glutathione S-transferase [Ideonella azotifigens]MCD2342614.1 glutathione S-transferase [Ideonella azotifigens]